MKTGIRNRWLDDDRWYYVVSFSPGDYPIVGVSMRLHVPVLMDGTAVQAANRPEKR
jgi:hypothetical protein